MAECPVNEANENSDDYDFADDFLYFFEGRTSEERSDREAEPISGLVHPGDGKSLLDLACGSGRMANRLAARGGRVVGVDLSASFIARATQNGNGHGVNV